VYLASLVLSTILSAHAADPCKTPSSTVDVLSCMEQNHPNIKQTAFDDKIADGALSSLTQFPNPQLEVETTKGEVIGDVVGESRLAVSQLIEIGGKRSARRKLGEAEAKAIRTSSAMTKNQVKSENILTLIRYRQIIEEIAVLEEALETYQKVDRQFSSRPRLSPDQQVSFSIFKLAIGDYRHRLASLQADRRVIESYFKLIPELSFAAITKYLPKRRVTWPAFVPKASISESPAVKAAEAEFQKADAAYDLARANSWPDPTVSLIATQEVEATTEWQKYGVGLSFPLPFWNLNGGERRKTLGERTKAEIAFRTRSNSIVLERQNLLESYQEFVVALNKSPAPKEIDQKHRSTESLFYQGLISGALVIEAHRQILEFTQTQNELELETTQALLSLYALENRLGEFKHE